MLTRACNKFMPVQLTRSFQPAMARDTTACSAGASAAVAYSCLGCLLVTQMRLKHMTNSPSTASICL